MTKILYAQVLGSGTFDLVVTPNGYVGNTVAKTLVTSGALFVGVVALGPRPFYTNTRYARSFTWTARLVAATLDG